MSRTPGASCLLDVRTTAILQDYIITTNNCAPGVNAQLARRNKLGGVNALENCEPPACGFDRPRDLLSVLGAVIIISTVIGVIHSYVVFLPTACLEYSAGFIEYNLVAATTYLVMLLTACLSYPVIEYAGHKLTALFGMILMFVGILIDSQVFHISIMYVGNIILVGIGGGLAYAASMSLPADLFRAKLGTALMLISIAGSIGTIFYTWMCAYVIYSVGYKWAKLLQAILVLFFTLSVHVFPKTRLMYASGCDPTKNGGTDTVQDCVYKSVTSAEAQQKKTNTANNCPDEAGSKNLLCVCVCDLRLYGDKSFLLWACLVMIGTMNFYVPYLTINSYAESAGAGMSFWYITAYCIGSIVGRCAFIGNVDFTFAYNRAVFQGCIMVSGIMWIVVNWAVTFGWIIVVCVVLGVIEGIICVVTSRVAIGTIPWRWLSGAWLTCMICHAIGIYTMSTFTVVIVKRTFHYTLTYITSGVIQVIVSLMAVLLPNEYEDENNANAAPAATTQSWQDKSFVRSNAYSTQLSSFGQRPNYDLSKLCGGYGNKFYGSAATRMGLGSFKTQGTGSNAYKCKCAICSKFGCIPDCLPQCIPGGSLDCTSSGNQSEHQHISETRPS